MTQGTVPKVKSRFAIRSGPVARGLNPAKSPFDAVCRKTYLNFPNSITGLLYAADQLFINCTRRPGS